TKIIHEGTLVVNARPGDQIFLDGALVGVGTWRGVVSSGGHMLRVTAPEMRAYQSDVVVRDKETRTVAITLDKEVKPGGGVPSWVWIGGGALLVASASVGGYFLFKPEDKQPAVPVGTLEPGNVQASFPGVQFR
ncbi:MAG TPA: PEGA domain-containing protein, partial [Labilithrix sp.]|nr:PEGA domain-containing protein [Labilithrix sp.]